MLNSVRGLPALSGFRVAFVGHSRGGLVARSFLTGTAANPSLAGFLSRVTALITLHSPNAGSGVASVAATVAGLLGRLATAYTGAGLSSAAAFVTMLNGFVLNPVRGELVPGSAALAAIAAAEPIAGVTYHTFGAPAPTLPGYGQMCIRLTAQSHDSFHLCRSRSFTGAARPE
ncbi:MAG: hypothetical protein NDI90_15580 [Nitrospira sp. BO4]|jgi:hypothetical protein|nr:hypothetical protein [Nitrospira sp. BO4]